jgi:hypothetical protein
MTLVINFLAYFFPWLIIEISVKSGKDSTSTLSLLIHRVRSKKNLQKSTLAFNGGWNSENHQIFLSFTLSFFFPEPLHCYHIDFHCSYLSTIIPLEPCALNAAIQHFVLSFTISYWDLIKFPYFTDPTKRGVRGVKGGPKMVNLGISLIPTPSCIRVSFQIPSLIPDSITTHL